MDFSVERSLLNSLWGLEESSMGAVLSSMWASLNRLASHHLAPPPVLCLGCLVFVTAGGSGKLCS